MAVSVVQTASSTLFTNPPLSFGSPVTAGNTVFIVLGSYCTSGATMSTSAPTLGGSPVTGATAFFNAGTTNGINSPTTSLMSYLTVWMLPNVPGGATSVGLTVTANTGVSGIVIYEVSGLGATPVLDKSNSGNASNSTAVSSGASGAINGAAEFVLGSAAIFNNSAGGPGVWTVTEASSAVWAGYQTPGSSGGSYTWSQTGSSTGAWASAVASVTGSVAASASLTVTPTFTAVPRSSLKYVTLTLDVTDGSGRYPSIGTASFTPSAVLTDAGTGVVSQAPITAVFRGNQAPSVSLLATDNNGPLPTNWTWQVKFNNVAGAPAPFNFALPFSAGVNQLLSNQIPVAEGSTFQAYMPVPSGTAISGQVPVATGVGEASAWGTVSSSGGSSVASTAVQITTLGSTFSPVLSLVAGSSATVSWHLPGGSTITGISPSIDFGSSATRLVYMTAADTNGYNALNQIATFNIGYNNSLDTGTYSVGGGYSLASQQVSAVTNIRSMTSLQYFLAENISTLTGTLDFTGMALLTNIELYGSGVQSVSVSGCTGLNRLVTEANKLTSENVNPVSPNLREFRSAAQQGGSLTLTPVVIPFGQLYHFCMRDQTVINMPNLATMLPVVSELWIWNTGQSGALAPASTSLTNLQAYSNSYTSANLANLFVANGAGYLDLHSNSLTSVTLTGCTKLVYVDVSNNLLTQSQVDGVLAVLAAESISNGMVNVGGTGNAAPSSAGLTSAATLTGRGWTVTHN